MEHLEKLTRSELKQLAGALRTKIKNCDANSTDPEIQKLVKQLDSVKLIIAEKVIKEAEEEATRRHMSEVLKSINPRTYRPQSGKPASADDRTIPEELMHRTYVPGETEIGNKPISIDEIFPHNSPETETPRSKSRRRRSK